jgi:ABC-type branched-subunit amino acid transport system ATPase component
MSDGNVEVLVICGAAGTGKTATLWEVGRILRTQGVHHALIDTDELDRVWPTPETTEGLISISKRNLGAVWETFSGLGIRHVVLCGVMASHAQSREWIENAIPRAAITFVRLSAEQSTRAQRLRDREVGSGFDQEMEASDRAARYIQEHDQPGFPSVATDEKAVQEVASEVLDVTHWLT